MHDAPDHPPPSGWCKNLATKNPRAPRKRPDRTSVSVSEETLARIDAYAAVLGLTRFATVNALLTRALDQDAAPDPEAAARLPSADAQATSTEAVARLLSADEPHTEAGDDDRTLS